MKYLLAFSLLVLSNTVVAEWVQFSIRSNGDKYYYDNERVEKNNGEVLVWLRVKYKTSVMAASSFQSLNRLNCSESSEIILQSTFFTDKNWAKPAMATNTNEKPKTFVQKGSATEELMNIVCEKAEG